MKFFDFLNDKTSHGLKTKIGMSLNKHDLWEDFIIEGNLLIDNVNKYDRTILGKTILDKEKNYILKGLIVDVKDEYILEHISHYVDYILPRSCYIKLGNKKDDYNGIKTIEGLSYFYIENNNLDNNEYTGENKVRAYKKEYFKYNSPYQNLNDKDLYSLLQQDIFEAELYLKPEYDKSFNRLTMLKLLHHFYFKTEFEDIDTYVCNREEYYELLRDDLIDQYVIDKEIEIGDFVVFSGVKYAKEVLIGDNTCGVGLVYNKTNDKEVKVYFRAVGLAEWFSQEELKVIDVTAKEEFIDYIQDVFCDDNKDMEISDEELYITKEKTIIEGIPLLKNKFIKVKSSTELSIYNKIIFVHVFNENDNYCFVQDNDLNEYLIDKKTNEIYEFDYKLGIAINEKQVAFLEDILFNLNRLEPMLKNYYNDYSVFLESPLPSIKQLNLISKRLNKIYKEQLKSNKKYKKFFNEFEPPFRINYYHVRFNIPKSKVGFENYSDDDIQEIIKFLDSFNHENIGDMKKFKELFILE